MKFLGVLTPEEAERDWGISRNGDLVITSGLSAKSKTSPSGKSNPSATGSKTPESKAPSEASNPASDDPMLPAMNGLEDAMLQQMRNLKATGNQHLAPSQPTDSSTPEPNAKT
jgi:hypothetical protein